MPDIAPVQAQPAAPEAPVAAPAAASTTVSLDAPVSLAAPEPSGLPMDLDSIDALFAGNASVQVSNEALVTSPAPGGPAAPTPQLKFAPSEPAPAVSPAAPTAPPVTPEPVTAAPEPVGTPVTQPERVLPNRIHTAQFEPEAQLAIDLQHKLNAGLRPGDSGFVPLAECLRRIETASAPPAQAAPVPPGPSIADIAQSKLTEAKSTLKELRTKRAELAEFGSDVSEIDGQIEAQQDSITAAQVEAALAARDLQYEKAAREAQAGEKDMAARRAAESEVAKEYPSVLDKASPLGAKVQQLAKAMENPQHPDHAMLFAVNASAFVTDRAAKLVAQEMEAIQGVPFAQALTSLRAAAPAVAPVAAVPDDRRILPASGALGTSGPGPAPTESEIMASIGNDPDAIDAALYAGRKAWRIGG